MVLPALPAERLSFVELMTLESVEEIDVNGESVPQFMGKYTAPNFGGSAGYGGYVYAQSVWAAAQSVAEGMVVHVCCLSLERSGPCHSDILLECAWIFHFTSL